MAGRVVRIASIAAVLLLGVLGVSLPDSLLVGGCAWLAFLFFVLSGMGWLVVRVARVADPDLGLRTTWGIAAYLAIAGVLLMFGICSRPFVLVLVAAGTIGFAWRELTTPEPIADSIRGAWRLARSNPLIAYVAVLIAALVVAQMIGAVVHLDRLPWDDDIAYTPLVKRLLDAGDLVEPFSFRRLASYGGQSVLQELVGARGNIASVHALDQGLCFGLVFLLLLGHARALRTSIFSLALVLLVLVMLPDTSINTASYWSGVVAFLALYRTIAAGHLMIAVVLGAATCTLRQNYIPVVALFFLLTLLSQLHADARGSSWREAWRAQRGPWLRIVGVSVAVLAPWCIAAFVSSRTFLFPFMSGTWNHGLHLGPPGWSWVDQLSVLVTAAIDSQPIICVFVIAPLIAFSDDSRRGRPVMSLFLASFLGFVMLAYSFTDADATTFWRYAFGFGVPLFIVFVLEVGDGGDDMPVRLPPLGRWILVGTLLIQLAATRAGQVKVYAEIATDIREAVAIDRHGEPNARVEARNYAAMQATVPAGAPLLVMLDDPAFLDFARNPIANLDVPGFASPGRQMPSFTGAEAMRAYLLDEGFRYVAFVRPESSRYAFRRGFWVWRLFNDTPFFQAMSAYAVDTTDSFVELATKSRVLHDANGLVVLDLEAPHGPAPSLDPATEGERRDAYTHALAAREHLEREWTLTTRRNVLFSDGMSGLTFAQADADAHWFDFVTRDPKPTRGVPIRWMYRRSHLRLRGSQDMHLVVRGHVNLNLLYTRPRLDVSLDGVLLTSVTVDESGAFSIEQDVPASQLDGWSDLYLMFNAIGQPDRDVKDLRLARLEEVTWEPR
jgi:hypothetical protein